jgi:hypothetical protein
VQRLLELWRDHSLTITLLALGTVIVGLSQLLPEGKGFDTVLGIGHGALTGGLLFWLQGPLREVKKPED